MNVHISYKTAKTPEIEREFQHQLQKLQPRLQVFKPELIHFHAIIDKQNGHAVTTSLNLRLPSGQLAVQESGDNIVAAIKSAFADLLSQVTRHKDLLRGQWNRKGRRIPGRKQVPAAELLSTEPLPTAGRAAPMGDGLQEGISQELAVWINASLPRLQRFIERELQYRIAAGQLREDLVSAEEVIDEVMVSVLSQDESKPQALSLESWLNRLALRALRTLAESNADTASVSLDAPAGIQNVTGSDESVLQYHQPDDSLPEESVIADSNVRTPEEIFASEEMVAQLDILLHQIRPEDREAFVLYSLEGFTIEEIARLSDQPPEHIRERIHHARKKLQQALPAQNHIKRSLLRGPRVA
ncbi:MAG TPA: sigma-70 family RNA polymerase sigma factor [Candidatus Angelobacter sp.]|jgi:RNA polymerase sigma factor (sigma-70 family)|nr:sigma-70 family RNA polymerase sigma factor [Candidatus Angelobacter sp.]